MNNRIFQSIMYLGLLPLTCLLGTLGNILMLITLSKHNIFGHSYYSFLSAIAALDLASIAFTVPIIITRCPICGFGETFMTEIFAAFIFVGIVKVSIVSSCWAFLALAFDCCLHIHTSYEENENSALRAKLRITSPWLLIFFISMVSIAENLPTFWYYKLDKSGLIEARENHQTVFYIYSWVDLMITGIIYLLLLVVLTVYLYLWYKNDTGNTFSRSRTNTVHPATSTTLRDCRLMVHQQHQRQEQQQLQQQPRQMCCVVQQQQCNLAEGQNRHEIRPGPSRSLQHSPCNMTCSSPDRNDKQHNSRKPYDDDDPTPKQAHPGNDQDSTRPNSTSSAAQIKNMYYSKDQLRSSVRTVIALAAFKFMTLGPGVVLQAITIEHGAAPDVFYLYQTITTLFVALTNSLKILIYVKLDAQIRQACKTALISKWGWFAKVRKRSTPQRTMTDSFVGSHSSAGTTNFPAVYQTEMDHLERPSSLTGLPSPRDTIHFFREQATHEAQQHHHKQPQCMEKLDK